MSKKPAKKPKSKGTNVDVRKLRGVSDEDLMEVVGGDVSVPVALKTNW